VKRNFFWFSLLLVTGVFAHGTALADRITIDGGFTSFSGMVGFAGDAYIRALAGPTAIDCSQIDCSNPLLGFDSICPDAGCDVTKGDANLGQANVPIGSVQSPAEFVTFKVPFNPPNELDFVPHTAVQIGNPDGEFLLGQFTFGNGSWEADADLGLTITLTDETTDQHSTFTGFVHMTLTPNVGTPEDNADFIYLTDANHNPVAYNSVMLPSLRVFEGGTATVDVFGFVDALEVTRLADVSGDGFLDSSHNIAPSSAVPEPASIFLVGGALAALSIRARRRPKTGKR
jgi:hypothetical protein